MLGRLKDALLTPRFSLLSLLLFAFLIGLTQITIESCISKLTNH